MTNQEFIEAIAGYVQKYAYVYGIEVLARLSHRRFLKVGGASPNLPPPITTILV